MLRSTAALALIALVAVAPAAHAAGPPTMAFGDVRAGMSCTVASVIHGTAVTTFAAHVDDVIASGSDAASARILVTVSGPAVDDTGVGPGFSGSPITCPGADGTPRIIGAITETIGAYGGKTVLATPIAAILSEPVDPPHGATRSARASAAPAQRPPDLRAAQLLRALAGRRPRLPAGRARAPGRTLVLAPLRPRRRPRCRAIVPGSAIGVTLATGDVDAGAIGTAAYVDGSTVWGFGHPFDGAGRRSIFLTAAYIYGGRQQPARHAGVRDLQARRPRATIGTLTQDGVSGVVGRIGAPPPSFPLQVAVRDLDTRRLTALHAQVADERAIGLPTGSSALSRRRAGRDRPGALRRARRLAGRAERRDVPAHRDPAAAKKPLGFCNTYVGGGGSVDALAGGPLVADAAAATQLLDAYDAGPLAVTGVAGRPARRARAAPRHAREPRGPASVARGSDRQHPRDAAPPGRREGRAHDPRPDPAKHAARPARLYLRAPSPTPTQGDSGGDSATIDLSSLFEPSAGDTPPGPATVAGLARAMSSLHRYDGVTARILPLGAPVPQNLPGGAERFAQRSRRVFRDPLLRVAGRARLAIVVR